MVQVNVHDANWALLVAVSAFMIIAGLIVAGQGTKRLIQAIRAPELPRRRSVIWRGVVEIATGGFIVAALVGIVRGESALGVTFEEDVAVFHRYFGSSRVRYSEVQSVDYEVGKGRYGTPFHRVTVHSSRGRQRAWAYANDAAAAKAVTQILQEFRRRLPAGVVKPAAVE